MKQILKFVKKSTMEEKRESKREIGSLVNPGVRSIGADDVEDLLHDQAVLAGVDRRVLSVKVRVVLYRYLLGQKACDQIPHRLHPQQEDIHRCQATLSVRLRVSCEYQSLGKAEPGSDVSFSWSSKGSRDDF
jgi:hypothetical protein